MSNDDLPLFEAIHTQRAIRRFDDRPVSSRTLEKILDAAIRAPSGGNRQPWRFIVIREPATRERLADWYLSAWQAATAGMDVLSQPYRDGAELARQMRTVPVLVLACVDHEAARAGPRPLTHGSSIYPAVQNLLLAARALGLGTVLTTLHTRYEDEIKALLGIPEHVETAALVPIGYPAEGSGFGGARRKPLSEVVFEERWHRDD